MNQSNCKTNDLEKKTPERKQQLSGDVLEKDEYEFLSAALQIHRNAHGCTTPIEEFICGLVGHHVIRALTISDIEQDLEECRENFADAIAVAAYNVLKYPDLIREKLPEGWKLSIKNEGAAA